MAYTKCKPNPKHQAFFIGKRDRVLKIAALRRWERKKYRRATKFSDLY
jgi:hypothetical protein